MYIILYACACNIPTFIVYTFSGSVTQTYTICIIQYTQCNTNIYMCNTHRVLNMHMFVLRKPFLDAQQALN